MQSILDSLGAFRDTLFSTQYLQRTVFSITDFVILQVLLVASIAAGRILLHLLRHRRYSLSGRYIASYENPLKSGKQQARALVRLRHLNNRVRGTEVNLRTRQRFVLRGTLSKLGDISGSYESDDQSRPGQGVFYLARDADGMLSGFYCGYGAIEKRFVYGAYSLTKQEPRILAYRVREDLQMNASIGSATELADPSSYCLYALSESGKPIGVIAWKEGLKRGATTVSITALNVSEAHRNAGVASYLVRSLKQRYWIKAKFLRVNFHHSCAGLSTIFTVNNIDTSSS